SIPGRHIDARTLSAKYADSATSVTRAPMRRMRRFMDGNIERAGVTFNRGAPYVSEGETLHDLIRLRLDSAHGYLANIPWLPHLIPRCNAGMHDTERTEGRCRAELHAWPSMATALLASAWRMP